MPFFETRFCFLRLAFWRTRFLADDELGMAS
jgi:hypothetical protein